MDNFLQRSMFEEDLDEELQELKRQLLNAMLPPAPQVIIVFVPEKRVEEFKKSELVIEDYGRFRRHKCKHYHI